MNTIDKGRLFVALDAFINQRPGFDPANYGNWQTYRADARVATRQLRDARELARVARWDASAEKLASAFCCNARRLTWNGERLDYTTGQYWPLEYRAAVARALADAIWNTWFERLGTGDAIRRKARDTFGRGLAGRWFS